MIVLWCGCSAASGEGLRNVSGSYCSSSPMRKISSTEAGGESLAVLSRRRSDPGMDGGQSNCPPVPRRVDFLSCNTLKAKDREGERPCRNASRNPEKKLAQHPPRPPVRALS